MISCTEFIPAYSELFSYIEDCHGREAVSNFWKELFNPTTGAVPLDAYIAREGIRGCFSYWTHSLNEEAADFTMYLNEKAGWFLLVMHHCPSKGRLLDLQQETRLEPYHDYCLHCDSYRFAVEKHGLRYIYNFAGVERAACSILIYDPAVFRDRVIVDGDTEIMDRKAAQNEYFHRDFHISMNKGIQYLSDTYGEDEVKAFFRRYALRVHAALIERIRKEGLAPIEAMIRETYRLEKAEDVLQTELTDRCLTVSVSRCPAVSHLRQKGVKVSAQFPMTTTEVMKTLTEEGGLSFTMDDYDARTGAARYHFIRL